MTRPARHARSRWMGIAGGLALGLGPAAPASAHPHVWVTVETTVLFDNGTITGFRHKWTFDEFYTAMAIEGLDTNKDGVYSREELAELAQVNIDGLKEFGFFTHPKLGEAALKLGAAKDFHLEHGLAERPANVPDAPPAKDDAPQAAKPSQGLFARLGEAVFGKPKAAAADAPVPSLSLHMTLPLEKPVLADAEGFAFAVYDPTFFIAMDLAKGTPVKLGAGAPNGCRIDMGADDGAPKPGDAFSQIGGGIAVGFAAAKPIRVLCGSKL